MKYEGQSCLFKFRKAHKVTQLYMQQDISSTTTFINVVIIICRIHSYKVTSLCM